MEVTVSRRVYRSGESEYRLNGTSCRLKDIQEIFYDTGIGKEGYSIIGQGQIEKILSGRPEDRRELFDEAAGIVKFKRRKAAAVKKLEDERANLVRVNDILSELQRQLVPLQHQAEQAKIYLKKKEELKKIDLHLFLLEMEQRKAELANLDEKRKIAEEQLSDIKKEYETIRVHYETEEKAIEELEERIEQIREQERQSQLLHQQLTGQIEVLKEQIRAQEDQEVRLKERKSVIESELSGKEKQRKAEQQAFLLAKEKQEQVSLTEADCCLEADATTAMLSHLEMQIEDGKNEIISLLNQRASVKGNVQRYDTMQEQMQIRKAEVTGKLLRIGSEDAECRRRFRNIRLPTKRYRKRLKNRSGKAKSRKIRLNSSSRNWQGRTGNWNRNSLSITGRNQGLRH